MAAPSSGVHQAGQVNPVTFLFLIVLSVIGVGITDYSPADAHRYWLLMIFVCATVATLFKRAATFSPAFIDPCHRRSL
ncbi:MAG: hypothetical protein ABFS24_04365 [Pseudomonadota bacterium]